MKLQFKNKERRKRNGIACIPDFPWNGSFCLFLLKILNGDCAN
jgi:hypothetical protein